jgi:hypothetical protein
MITIITKIITLITLNAKTMRERETYGIETWQSSFEKMLLNNIIIDRL